MGFEPTDGSAPSSVFKTDAIDHSAISPHGTITTRTPRKPCARLRGEDDARDRFACEATGPKSDAYDQPLSRTSSATSTVANAIHSATVATNIVAARSRRTLSASHTASANVATFPTSSIA